MFKVVEARGFDIKVIADLLMHFGRVLQLKKKNTHTKKSLMHLSQRKALILYQPFI